MTRNTGVRRGLGWTCLGGVAVVLATGSMAGCGGDDAADELRLQQQLRQERAEGRREERQRQLERELRDLKRDKGKFKAQRKNANPPSGSSGSTVSGAADTSCGNGISVGANTTCAFAYNVATAYYESGGGTVTVQAASPVTRMVYSMTCTAGAPTVCRGGNNASVFIH